MDYHIALFANLKYLENQEDLKVYASSMNLFKSIRTYTHSWLYETEFYKTNKTILDQKRGAGFWLWKPYVIWETMKSIPDGDIVFYLDCGDHFLPETVAYTKPILEKENCLLLGGSYIQKYWTKRDCFFYMNTDEEKYTNVLQLEAGIQFWKKTELSMQILEEQIKWCSDYRILTDSQNECGLPNYEGFIDHRHDQSVLTNLSVKYNLPVDSTRIKTPYNGLRKYVRCNVL